MVNGGITLDSSTSASTTFIMPEGAVEVTATYEDIKSPIPQPTPTYTITAGADETYQIGSEETLTITCSGPLDELTGIYVDGSLLDSSNYTLKSGSTILTLKEDYLKGLNAGTHTLSFAYGSNIVQTSFQVTATTPGTINPVQAGNDKTNLAPSGTDTTPSLGKDDVPKTGDFLLTSLL